MPAFTRCSLLGITAYALGLLLLAPLSGWSQTEADRAEAARQADQLQRQSQERVQRDIESGIRSARPPQAQDPKDFMPRVEVPGAGPGCRVIQTVVITSAPSLAASTRDVITRTYAGQCIGVNEIEQILAMVTKDYVDRGFITTRAYLPSQDLTSGRLEIMVIEGIIEKILINDGGASSIYALTAFPTGAGQLLNLRDLEQGIDQVNRLSSNDAVLDIQPGSTPGGSVVVVNNQPRRPFHAALSLDNQGSEGTGREQVALTLTADRLLGLNELWVLTKRQSQPNDTGKKASDSDSLTLLLPWGYSTLSLALSRSTYTTTVNAPSGLQLKANGRSDSDNLKLERTVYRDQTTRVSLTGGLTFKRSENFLADQLLVVSSRKLSVMDVGLTATTGLLGGAITGNLGLAKGLTLADALQDVPGQPETAPKAQFNKAVFGLQYSKALVGWGNNWSVSSQLSGQTGGDALYGSEQFVIGGIYSVRGFDRNTLSGDKGYSLRNELSLHLKSAMANSPVSTRLYLALDTGEVSSFAVGVPQGQLTGMAIGLTTSWKGASLDIFTARPLSQPNFMTPEAPQTWARLNFAI